MQQPNATESEIKNLMLKPTPLPEVHKKHIFCKNKHTNKCSDLSCDLCNYYEEIPNISYADKIVMLIDDEKPTFLKDQYNNFFVSINDDNTKKTVNINSEEFKQICRDRFYRAFGKVPRSDYIKDAIKTFEAISRNTQTRTLRPRVNLVTKENGENEIWIDLCDKYWQSIRITKDDYKKQDVTPPLFKRYKHMKELPLPRAYDGYDANDSEIGVLADPPILDMPEVCTEGGCKKTPIQSSLPSSPSQKFPYLMRSKNFINLSDNDFFLTLCHMVNVFFVDRPQTTLSINGKKGSGKTCVSEFIKKILDPSVTLTLDLPKNRDELLHNLDHHFYPCFDNVSWLSHEFSDIFCRANTGAGTFKRVLYTNDEEFIRSFLKSINLNGINVVVVREDLLDRTLLVFAQPFNSNRKTEAELETEFNKIYPYILHDLYSLVSEVMYLLPETEAPNQFRMMDFGKVGCAVAKALGYDREYFIKIYTNKLNEQIKEAIYNHTFGNVLLSFMEDKPKWTGSSTELYRETKAFAKDVLKVSTQKKDYPSASNIMSRQLNDLIDAFSKIGIDLIKNDNASARGWIIVNRNLQQKNEIDDSFINQCSNCGATLQFEWYPYGKLRLCHNCHLEIEALKKKTHGNSGSFEA